MTRLCLGVFSLALVALGGCKDGVVEPETFGQLSGVVLDFETGNPISGAGVTTSPATDAIITDGDGAFRIEDIPTGAYTITASRNGYDPNTTTVSVRENRSSGASLFLRPEDDDDDEPGPLAFGAEVLNFTPEIFATDSSYVRVEYRALNNGDVTVANYEIYFRIDTDRGPFYQEIRGEDLQAGERDVSTFRKYLIGATPTTVVVEDTQAFEGSSAQPVARTASGARG